MEPDRSSRFEVAEAPDEHPPRRLLVVPSAPGPLRPLETAPSPDELDALIDEVFGSTTDEGPGRFDIVLVIGGAALIGWGFLTSASGWLALGAIGLVLGLALPVRQVLRSSSDRRRSDRERRLADSGLLLDPDDAATADLVHAYAALVRQSTRSRSPLVTESLAAGHAAVREVASLLRGRRPVTDVERTYVARRTTAIRDVAGTLSDALTREEGTAGAALADADADARAAVVQARELLDADSGVGAIDELERIQDRLRTAGSSDGR